MGMGSGALSHPCRGRRGSHTALEWSRRFPLSRAPVLPDPEPAGRAGQRGSPGSVLPVLRSPSWGTVSRQPRWGQRDVRRLARRFPSAACCFPGAALSERLRGCAGSITSLYPLSVKIITSPASGTAREFRGGPGWPRLRTRARFRGSFPAKNRGKNQQNETRSERKCQLQFSLAFRFFVGFVFGFFLITSPGAASDPLLPLGSDVVFLIFRRKLSWGKEKLSQKIRSLPERPWDPRGRPGRMRSRRGASSRSARERSERCAAAGAAPLPPRAAGTRLQKISFPRTRKNCNFWL